MISIFEIFKIGLGPSSSHTTGPMVSALRFLKLLEKSDLINKMSSVNVELYGSLALTGIGHHSDRAIAIGLMGYTPESIEWEKVNSSLQSLSRTSACKYKNRSFHFDLNHSVKFFKSKVLPIHSNGMCFIAKDKNNKILLQKNYYSIGGGFVISDESEIYSSQKVNTKLPYHFDDGKTLLELCLKDNLSISELTYKNECHYLSPSEIDNKLLKIWKIMKEGIDKGLDSTGLLPGPLKVKRRANSMLEQIKKQKDGPLLALSSLELYALAVSEENANGGRIVTAPTNGAAGIIPSVINYYLNFIEDADLNGVKKFLLTAGAIGTLYKKNASISGAEVGCQGEVGVASSMAAAGLAEVLGGSVQQVENAAEIAMEHGLGLTCDPVGGYVQIPCIERNAMGAVKAVAACQMALLGDGKHHISLDKVIRTMKQTGLDMATNYKETSLGGLAVNIPEC